MNDAASGKRTLVVRLGGERAKNYHTVLLGTAFLALVVFVVGSTQGHWAWLFLLGFVPIGIHAVRVQANTEPRALDPELKRLALGTLLTAVAFSAGLCLSA